MDIFGNFSKLRGDKSTRIVKKIDEHEFNYAETVMETGGRLESKDSVKSIFFVKFLIIATILVLVCRLFVMQVVSGSTNAALAEGNRTRPRVIEAERGNITDSSGKWLARNKASFSLAVYPSDLPKNTNERTALYQKLSDLTGMTVDEIKKTAEKNGLSSLDEVDIKDNISHDDALVLEQKISGLPGVFVATKTVREYQNLAGLAHIIGYTGIVSASDLKNNPEYYLSDRIGKDGLEAIYEKYLRGIYGVEQIEVDSKGNITKVLASENNKEPVAGDNLTLYLDLDLQEKTAEALQSGIAKAQELAGDSNEVVNGTAIVMDVKTGGILSMVSLPSYDNNLFATKISNSDYQNLINDASLPMFNRAISGVYPPGSISKIIMASAGLSEGTITKNTSIVTPAAITIGDYVFPDWKDHSYESTNIERAIAESNDIFFYALGGGYDSIKGMGIDTIKKYWQLFGLGEKTGIDLPGEASGLLPDNAWKKAATGESWYLGDTYHVSIGQGDLLVTPLQMLRATAVIASNGKLFQPQLVKEITDSSGNVIKEFEPRVERENFLSQETIKTVAEGMRMAVTSGSARSIFPSDYLVEVAGKTGTAQFLNNAKTHAWFECYAPYDDPEIAIVVLVEGGGEGYEIAAPVAKDITSYYFSR